MCYFCNRINHIEQIIMRIDILTVVPELLESPLSHSIVGRAIKKGLVEIHVHNLRKYGKGPRLQVDDYSYGGDVGMVLMLEPVFNMIQELKAERDYDEVIYMSPDGEILNQNIANELSLKGNIIILCGHIKELTIESGSTSSLEKFPAETMCSAVENCRQPYLQTLSSALSQVQFQTKHQH